MRSNAMLATLIVTIISGLGLGFFLSEGNVCACTYHANPFSITANTSLLAWLASSVSWETLFVGLSVEKLPKVRNL